MLDVIHTDCLVSHIKSFPPSTAPAGYDCPACSVSVWCIYACYLLFEVKFINDPDTYAFEDAMLLLCCSSAQSILSSSLDWCEYSLDNGNYAIGSDV